MTRLVLPIIFIGAAIGLFVVYINPTYQQTKAISAQVAQYDDALTKSKELRTVRDGLVSKLNTFSPDDIAKLSKMLPDNVDNIRFIIDLNNIASRRNLILKGLSLSTLINDKTQPDPSMRSSTGDPVGTYNIGFGVTASYDNIVAFMQDLEHSLRLIDIQSFSFAASPTGVNDYSISIRTYWLK